ncbi:MAG: indolepyruvate ferredoxin oxidoreductase subunit alpha [Clostridium sp.]|nr:indolepyruvate ferredoxin oxidoreductase subunit alpha [Acetatifactor muris]MCM1528319.1 indolepyruvate ferredoxin oxidoreductase subunit alpha [Bacteroides sp.]MCM1563020.1 indolepyruvate ferredoxin oxidoreductase subunit alpha [Clostridium sp.]
MRQLLLGNKAFARGLYEAGCEVVSSYPGTPSTEVTEEAAKYDEIYCEWAPNEKVALEVAFGASLAGKRSFCGMKHVGLNVAADPLFTASYTGVRGGLVICVADDPGMHSSQNEQDSRHHAIASKVPMLEPADSAETCAFVKQAYELSERFDTPVIVRMCTRVAHSQSVVDTAERVVPDAPPYEKDTAKYIMTPANAIKRHPKVEERMRKLAEYAEDCPFNRVEPGDPKLGIITSSTSYQYAKEVFGEKASILKLGMVNPLPRQLILDFAAKVERLVIIEELDPIIEDHCRRLGLSVTGRDLFPLEGEFSGAMIADKLGVEPAPYRSLDEQLPGRPPVMCAGCPHRGLFYTLARNKCTVMGDIGCYTLGSAPPLSAIDMVLCMGASVSSLHGFNKATGGEWEDRAVAVIGDSTFVHSGMTGLANIAYNQSNSTVIILDNSITGMTGHQQNPTTGYNIKGDPAGKIDLEALCRAMGIRRVTVIDPYDLQECDRVLKEELAADEPSVIISRRPCVLLKYVQPKPPIQADCDKCTGCRSCMRLGCPAISIKDGKVSIDATLCVGCGVCSQLCKFGALKGDLT